MAQTKVENARVVGAVLESKIRAGVNTETLGAAKTLVNTDNFVQFIDAGGTARTVTLPAEASSDGLMFMIVNTGGEDLNVLDDGGTTTVIIATTECGIVVCNGTQWNGFVGATT